MKHTIKVLPLLVIVGLLPVNEVSGQSPKASVSQTSHAAINAGRNATLVNINDIAMWIHADGRSANIMHAGGFFPRGNDPATQVLFQDGIVWGGRVMDGIQPDVRVGGQTFSIGTKPGIIDQNRQAVFEDRIWRIRRDYSTADLTLDARELGLSETEVRQQYADDWRDWPADKSAPFYDADNDGLYSPQFNPDGSPILFPEADEPGLADADQVVWLVANDLDSAAVHDMYGSPPIGLEMQATLWAYAEAQSLNRVIFKRYRLIYKGTPDTPEDAVIDSMYISQWSDPDIGIHFNDFAGCDTLLNLGYVYNAVPEDRVFSQHSLIPPAVGYDLLQGPIVASPGDTALFDFRKRPEHRNQVMTTYAYLAGDFHDPPRGGDYNGTLQWYNLLRGYRPAPEHPPFPWTDPFTGGPTKYRAPGDPVAGEGWIDANPSERQFHLASGPFQMALGDTQEVVIGLMAGMGGSHLLSVSELKETSRATQLLYDNGFEKLLDHFESESRFISPQETQLKLSASTSSLVQAVRVVLTDSTGSTVAQVELFDDGMHDDEIPGDGLFSNHVALLPRIRPLSASLEIETANRQLELPDYQKITTAGPVFVSNLNVVADNINQDGKINAGENVRLSAALHNGSSFGFSGVSASFAFDGPVVFDADFQQNFEDIAAGTTIEQAYDPYDSTTFASFQIRADAQAGALIMVVIDMLGTFGNQWQQRIALPVEPFPVQPGEETVIDHVSGTGGGDFTIRLIEPSVLTGHDYEIRISEPDTNHGHHTFDLVDIVEDEVLFSRHPLPDAFSHNIAVVDGFKLYGRELETRKPVTYIDKEHRVDANPVDPGLNLWFDGTAFSVSGDLAAVIGGDFPKARLDLLELDIELRFTGVPAGGATIDDQNDTLIVAGGQWATQWDREAGSAPSSLNGLQWVPVRLPFELWDIENNRQINCIVINRNADENSPYGDGVGDPNTPGSEPRWRIAGRDYFIPHMSDYDQTFAQNSPFRWDGDYQNGSPNSDFTTWWLFFHQGGAAGGGDTWTTGDVYRLTYPNPLKNDDIWRFSTNVTSVDDGDGLVRTFELFQNYPNPFNPTTAIRYRIARAGNVKLSIYNILGQEVARLVDKPQPVGEYTLTWDGRDRFGRKVASGLYFYQIKAEGFERVRKMLLVR